MTDIRFQALGPSKWKADALMLFMCEGEKPDACKAVDDAAPWLAIAPAARDFRGEADDVQVIYGHPSCEVPRIVAVGLGKRSSLSPDSVRKAAALAAARCRKLGLKSALLPVPVLSGLADEKLPLSALIEESVCGALLGQYAFTQLKTPNPEDKAPLQWLAVADAEEYMSDDVRAAARRGENAAEAVARARDFVNMPPNMLYPAVLAEKAEELAAERGIKCTVFDEKALTEMGCNCLLAVGWGSAREARLVVLEYAPAGHENDDPIVFVGKGLTFDSGGICIKPPQNMHTMKSDMSGAAAVLSTLCAAADEKLPRRIVGVLTSAENMPSGSAMRPGDVVRAYNGKTVEILNTDAEGRLALCDALAYVQRTYKAAAIVDIATLTGACAVALGKGVAGVFSDDAALAEAIRSCGKAGGEHFWQLPLWNDYLENMKSDVADISHMGTREGGAIQAALFLKYFIEDGVRWAHLDIAGTDWIDRKTPLCPAGGAGYGVRTLLELARRGV